MAKVRKLAALGPILKIGYDNGSSIADLAKTYNAAPATVRAELVRQGAVIKKQGRVKKEN